MAYPDYSKKHGATVCMAGITEDGDLRRIYPIPFNEFRETGFQKRRWIEYEVKEKGDYRKESRKIERGSVVVGKKESYTEVRNRLEKRATTIDELNRRKEDDDTSLGFVRPDPDDIDLAFIEDENRRERAKEYREQVTLTMRDMPVEVIPYRMSYQFRCLPECSTIDPHSIMCEDIEIGQLYRKMRDKYSDENTVEEKVRQKFVRWMIENKDLYFMVGTHFQYGTWLIISVLYPNKRTSQDLGSYG